MLIINFWDVKRNEIEFFNTVLKDEEFILKLLFGRHKVQTYNTFINMFVMKNNVHTKSYSDFSNFSAYSTKTNNSKCFFV